MRGLYHDLLSYQLLADGNNSAYIDCRAPPASKSPCYDERLRSAIDSAPRDQLCTLQLTFDHDFRGRQALAQLLFQRP